MLTRLRLCLGAALTAAALATMTATGALAATASLEVTRFDRTDLKAAQAARTSALGGSAVRGSEFFGDYKAWDGKAGTTNPQNTKVGSFSSFGAKGSGHSVVGDASKLQVRNDPSMPWGRYGTSESAALGGNWLDSNDNLGMRWDVASSKGKFNSVSFFVLDAADVGGKFSIKVGDQLFSNIAGSKARLANGNIQFVRIMLSEAVSSLRVELMHDRTNDGFGVDGASVALAPIPLPPAAFLMLGGIAGFGFLRRRRTGAAPAPAAA